MKKEEKKERREEKRRKEIKRERKKETDGRMARCVASQSVQTCLFKSTLRIKIGCMVKNLETILILDGKNEKKEDKKKKKKVALTSTLRRVALTSVFILKSHLRRL